LGGRHSGICLGSNWSERHIGNNGVGTALALGEAVFVYGIEHYAASLHSAHCLGVPIRVDGRIVGCLDVSVTTAEDADPAYMALAQACVVSIETSLSHMVRVDTRAAHLERFAAMGGLLATTLHDLRNPLTVMKGISQIGATTAKDADERAYFQKLRPVRRNRSGPLHGAPGDHQGAQGPCLVRQQTRPRDHVRGRTSSTVCVTAARGPSGGSTFARPTSRSFVGPPLVGEPLQRDGAAKPRILGAIA
jgi:transcriptional regulator of acetoin/glycerol metabolism